MAAPGPSSYLEDALTERQKTVLLGMNNPHSLEQALALAPVPRGSTGSRLYEMLREVSPGVGPDDYLRGFKRVNLVRNTEWCFATAKANAPDALEAMLGRRTVVLGRYVQMALGLAFTRWFEEMVVEDEGHGEIRYWVVPHPSGMCRLYNAQANRAALGRLLLDEMTRQS